MKAETIGHMASGCVCNKKLHHLLRRVSKRMKALSALLHWERALLRRALSVWLARNAVWRLR